MIAKMSELFEVDVEELQRVLHAIDITTDELKELLESRNYLETEIVKEVHHLRDLNRDLNEVYNIIEIKAERYRPNNAILHNYLKNIKDLLQKLKFLIEGVYHNYYYAPNYIKGQLYPDTFTIKSYVEEILNLVNSAIRRGAFM